MCGIIGQLNMKPLDAGVAKLSHRGPDATGKFQSDQWNLGHTRLSIVDLSTSANQPFHSADNRYILVYNGELYNYKELANKHALSLRTNSDTEVIVELYAKLGATFLSELNGMFAGAIYDTQSKEIFLFRDRLGIKPLYYWKLDDKFAFASELPALLEIIDKPQINQQSVSDFLHLGYIPEPNTIYNDVHKFPSGAYGIHKTGNLTIKNYWRAEDYISTSVISNEKNVIADVEEILRDSVKMRLMADVPFGTFLSGGADSGLISAIAADISRDPINTFNVSFEDAVFDETPFALQMAAIIKSNHYTITVTKEEVLNNLRQGIKLVGEPFADSSVFPTMAVSKFASQHVKMALSGDGGDELFMGYGSYTWADRMNKTLIRSGRKAIAAGLRMKGGNRNNRAANVFDFRSTDSIQSHIFSQEQNLFSANEVEKITGRLPIQYKPQNFKRNLNAAEEQAFFDLTHYLKDDLLTKVDRSSMYYGLEVRVPFLDHRLVEYAFNINPTIKRKNGEQKYIIKKIMERYYPNDLLYRKKWGFSVPLEKWLQNSDLLKEAGTNQLPFKKVFADLNSKYQNSEENAYLYNRLYAIKCLAPYI